MIPEPMKSMAVPFIAQIKENKGMVLDMVDQGGPYVSMVVTAIDQVMQVVGNMAADLAKLANIPEATVQNILNQLKAALEQLQKLAVCTNAPKDCMGLLKLVGMAIRIGMPTIEAAVPALAKLLIGDVLTQLAAAGKKLEAGDKAGIAQLRKVIKTAESFTGFLPADIVKMIDLPLKIVHQILDVAEKCT
ncbi:hypothetical protein BGZ94_002288 [Podila epigama]|nr:hypothetical protein BGZ94_002288 [Podila epigama]